MREIKNKFNVKEFRKELKKAKETPLSRGDFTAYLMIALCFIFILGSAFIINSQQSITGMAALNITTNETGNYTIPVNETIPINETELNSTVLQNISIIVNETGLYGDLELPNVFVMFNRDKLDTGITVANTQTIYVAYAITLDFGF